MNSEERIRKKSELMGFLIEHHPLKASAHKACRQIIELVEMDMIEFSNIAVKQTFERTISEVLMWLKEKGHDTVADDLDAQIQSAQFRASMEADL